MVTLYKGVKVIMADYLVKECYKSTNVNLGNRIIGYKVIDLESKEERCIYTDNILEEMKDNKCVNACVYCTGLMHKIKGNENEIEKVDVVKTKENKYLKVGCGYDGIVDFEGEEPVTNTTMRRVAHIGRKNRKTGLKEGSYVIIKNEKRYMDEFEVIEDEHGKYIKVRTEYGMYKCYILYEKKKVSVKRGKKRSSGVKYTKFRERMKMKRQLNKYSN